jgi:putative GTP pyrophosphokinase
MNKCEEEILKGYRSLLPYLRQWGSIIDSKLNEEILSQFKDQSSVQMSPLFRVKDEKSFLYKALYRKKSYSDPLKDIEDKVGTRVVVLKSSDILVLSDAICNYSAWDSKITKNIDQEIENNPKNFDYQSLHIVVCPKDNDRSFDDLIKQKLTCEIQIRTLLQHAFAEISHDSAYKGPYKNDREIIRKLSKSMALMEATDDYFCNIFDLMKCEKRFFRNYMNDLTAIYKEINSNYADGDINFFITDAVMYLLDLKPVKIDRLSTYVVEENKMLSRIISSNQAALFCQPVFLLINYYFANHRSFLIENWPLSNKSLNLLYEVNNTSVGDL